MGTISLQIPQAGQLNSTEDAKVASDLTTIQTVINGNIDTNNISASAGITRSQLAGGTGNLVWTTVNGNTSAADGIFYNVGATATITLPTPTAGRTVGVRYGIGGAGTVTVAASSGSIGGVGLGTFGSSSFTLGTVSSFVVLVADGSNFYIVGGEQDTGWLAITLGTGASAVAGAYTPASRKVGDVVYLRGAVQFSGNQSVIGTLAAGTRPASTVYLMGFDGANAQTTSVSAAGTVTINHITTNGVAIPLDGYAFSLS